MHKESIDIMQGFINTLNPEEELRILDVGSLKIKGQGGEYRHLITSDMWEYVGVDVVEGDNVDVVAESPYRYPFEDKYFDVIITGQTLEHVAYIWEWIKELNRILKSGGKIFIIAPSRGHRHNRPDYWRIQPNGMNALLEYGGFSEIEVNLDRRSIWHDCWGEAKKM